MKFFSGFFSRNLSVRRNHASALGVQSILNKARAKDIVEDPFPHLVIRNALDAPLYDRLAAEFPSDEIMMRGKLAGNNKKHFYGAYAVLEDERISPLWRNFFRFHVSAHFFREVAALFGGHIRALFPDLETRLHKRINRLQPGIRRAAPSAEAAMDCQFGINSPVLGTASSVRGPHVDGPDTLFQCMLYFRDERDPAGGDLEFYRFKEGIDLSSVSPKVIDDSLVSKAVTIPYEKNTLVVFLNSPRSLHGVSPRAVTVFTRRYVGVLCDLPMKIFPRRFSSY